MKNYLAIDYGEAKIGLAHKIGDNPVVPSDIIANTSVDDSLHYLANLIIEKEIDVVVIGLPLTMKGEVGSQAEIVKSFGKKLHQKTKIEVKYSDERLTSKLFPGEDDDNLAAMNILGNYLNRNT